MREKTISQNPMLKIVSPKTAKKLPVIVDRQKMDQLLDGVAFKEGFEGIRQAYYKYVLSDRYATCRIDRTKR